MAAIWSWHEQDWVTQHATQGHALQETEQVLVSSPQSIQRVIFSTVMYGYQGDYNEPVPNVPSGGIMWVSLSTIKDGVYNTPFYEAQAVRTDATYLPSEGTSTTFHAYRWWIPTMKFDARVRLSPSAPPADPVAISWSYLWQPFPEGGLAAWTENGYFWNNTHLRWLTSEPGVTTPP